MKEHLLGFVHSSMSNFSLVGDDSKTIESIATTLKMVETPGSFIDASSCIDSTRKESNQHDVRSSGAVERDFADCSSSISSCDGIESVTSEFSYDEDFDSMDYFIRSTSTKSLDEVFKQLPVESLPPIPDYPLEHTSREIRGIPIEEITSRISECLAKKKVTGSFDSDRNRINCSTNSLKFAIQLYRGANGTSVVIEIQRRRGCPIEMHMIRRPMFQYIMSGNSAALEPRKFFAWSGLRRTQYPPPLPLDRPLNTSVV